MKILLSFCFIYSYTSISAQNTCSTKLSSFNSSIPLLVDSYSDKVYEIAVQLVEAKSLTIDKEDSDSLVINVYTDSPCNGANPVSTFNTVSTQIVIDLEENYNYIKLSSSSKTLASATLLPQQNIAQLNKYENKYNSFKTPAVIESMNLGMNCFNITTENCQVYHSEHTRERLIIDYPVKWISFQPVLNSSIYTLAGEANTGIIVYGIKNEEISKIVDQDFDANIEEIINALSYDEILLGYYSKSVKVKPIKLCIIAHNDNQKSCLNYFTEGSSLEPIYTSKGSSLEGPYQFGEEVTYKYSIHSWTPLKNNWLQGIELSHQGWKGLKYNSDSLMVYTPDATIAFDSIQSNEGVTYIDSLTEELSIDSKPLIVPAFYLKNNYRGSSGFFNNFTWGLENPDIQTDDTIYQMIFTLVADSIEECIPITSQLLIQPITDYEVGNWNIKGCFDEPLEYNNEIICCDKSDEHTLSNMEACDGESINFYDYAPTADEYYYRIAPNSHYEGPFLLTTDLDLEAQNGELTSYELKFVWNTGCNYSKEIEVLVKPLSNIDNPIVVSGLCTGEMFNISQYIYEEYDGALISNLNNASSPDDILNIDNEYYCEISSFKTSFQIELYHEEVCYNDATMYLNASDCNRSKNKDNSDLSLYVIPNLTYGRTRIEVQNNTNEQNYKLTILDGKGTIIENNNIFLIKNGESTYYKDYSTFPPGKYYVVLTGASNSKVTHLIILRN